MFCVNVGHSFVYYTHTEAFMTLVSFSAPVFSLYEDMNMLHNFIYHHISSLI